MRLSVFVLLLILIFSACTTKTVKKQPPAGLSPFPAGSVQAYVLKEKINVRSGPTRSGSVIETAREGEEVAILNNKNGWYRVVLNDGKKGWIRSDLIGPRSICFPCLATAYADSVLPAYKARIFLDKERPYQIVYLTLPARAYAARKKLIKMAKKIGLAYQHKVYPGKVEIRVLKPQNKELFVKINLPAVGSANLHPPLLPFGKLVRFDHRKFTIRLFMLVPAGKSNQQLLKLSRKISSKYDYPVKKVEILMADDSAQGLKELLGKYTTPLHSKWCRLYYLEDANGEDYHFGLCPKSQ